MDIDDDFAMQDQESDPVQPENEEEEEVEQIQPERKTGKSRGSIYDALDDDEEDEDEDEDEEEDDHRGRKRAKVRVLRDIVFELIQMSSMVIHVAPSQAQCSQPLPRCRGRGRHR